MLIFIMENLTEIMESKIRKYNGAILYGKANTKTISHDAW